ncbi:P-loop NTPase fold protein [Nereida sp. MMG025]|uniref:P-loop NTPase fold protein n=1 Tax=Nereida sp. MMG025 TaxID=2909981 RepID=UPI001EED1D64|nr:P-loop NTPase fold protein [Nereida sp. MMG025]MCF6445689.1 hypothetical protein [Nereida sp. MMG025]
METSLSFWIFQYTNGDRTGRLLEESRNNKSSPVTNWLWSSNRKQQPVPGDFVFFLRSGARPNTYPSAQPWRGIVGFGVVAGQPVSLENAQSAEGIPVETLAYFPDEVLPDYLIWHDHRIASAASIYGQQGANFLIDRDAAVGLVDELEKPEDGVHRADVHEHPALSALLEDRHRIDVVTREMDKQRYWVDRDAALALQFARAISAKSNHRSGELTWTHLFLGILLRAKGLQNKARANVASKALFELAAPNGDLTAIESYWEKRGTPIARLQRSDADPIEKMSTSARGAFTQAKKTTESSNANLISMDALLSGLVNEHAQDDVYRELFQADRDSLIERISKQVAANSRSTELEPFLSWVGRQELIGLENIESKTTGSPEGEEGGNQRETYEAEKEAEDITDRVPTGPQIANALNDSADRGQDLLDVEEEAKAFARLIASKSFEPPLAIGVFGPWGSGKTFFMNQIEKAISDLVNPDFTGLKGQPLQEKSSFHGKIVRIPFNAWHYMESNVWASLVDVIFNDLDAWLRAKNGGSKEGQEIDALFDSLSTAQEERLNAIEVLAERVKARERARNDLSDVEQRTNDYWNAVLAELRNHAFSDDKINDALNTLGLQKLSDEAANLQNAIAEARKTASNADLLTKSVRVRVSTPINLVGLGAAILLGPFLIGWGISFAETNNWFGLSTTFKLDNTITTITGLATSGTAWLGAVTKRAQIGVGALRKLQTKFDEIDAQRETPLAELKTDIDDAKAVIAQTEEAVAEAQARLMEQTTAGRVAAFIRERAESDVYSKHLGIIDTIRRDFEQLSALIENSKSGRDEKEILEQHKNHVAAQVDAIESRYDLRSEAYAPVKEALKKLEKTNETGVKLGTTFDRIVLYIDDLDRCPPDKVYEVLQAVHLFLTFPLFVVVVGVDTRWMEVSLVEELGELVDGTSGANPKNYLEKTFQIPYWTRRMDGGVAKTFVNGILPDPLPSSLSDGEDVADNSDLRVVAPETGSEAPSTSFSMNFTEELPHENDDASPAVEAGDPDLDDLQPLHDDDLASAGASLISTRPVIISPTERTLLADFAPYAGRSPRKLLRFVNVYGLIKSVDKKDGSPLIDLEDDLFASRALIAQLALATGAPEAAVHHFELIEKSVDYTGYYIKSDHSDPDKRPDVPPDISELIWEPLKKALPPGRDLKTDFDDLYKMLKLTAPVARRYTFASSDAVLAMEPEDKTKPSHLRE